MFAKAVVLVVALGACGCTLLSMRQARLQAASELVRIQLAVRSQDESLWLLRTRIAAAVTPDQVREMAAGLGPLRPLYPLPPNAFSTVQMRRVLETSPRPGTASPPGGPKPEEARPPRLRLANLESKR